MNSPRYGLVVLTMVCFVWLMACAHSKEPTQIGFDSARVQATDQIGLEFAEGVRLPEDWSNKQKVFTLQNFKVGTGPNRILIVGVQFELQGKASVDNTTVSSVTCGGHELSLIPGSEIQFSWIWKGTQITLKVALYYLIHPPSGSRDITVTYAGPVPSGNVGAISLYNVKQMAPIVLATNHQSKRKKEIITKVTTKNDGAWVVDMVACNHKSDLEPQTGKPKTNGSGQNNWFLNWWKSLKESIAPPHKSEGHILRFSAQEFLGGKSSLVCGTLPVPTAGEVTLHWAMTKHNRLALIALEVNPYR